MPQLAKAELEKVKAYMSTLDDATLAGCVAQAWSNPAKWSVVARTCLCLEAKRRFGEVSVTEHPGERGPTYWVGKDDGPCLGVFRNREYAQHLADVINSAR